MAKKKDKTELVIKNKNPSPFKDMERYFDEMFHHPFSFFRHYGKQQPSFPQAEMISPTVDIFEEGKDVVIKAEIPGIKKSDLSVDIIGNSMTISGEKKQEKKSDKKNYHRIECSYGSFCRSFLLPDNVKSDKAKASFKNGVLEVRMPTSGKNEKKKKLTIE